ncbi:MAG: tandem-95 repeat protein, partial [Caldilineae bacterium]
LPDTGLTLGGEGANRTLALEPLPDRFGPVPVTLAVDDGRVQTNLTIVVTVEGVNDGPTIGEIPAQATDEDTASGPTPFVVNDIDTPLEQLQLFGSSSNPALAPHTNIVFGGSGSNRTVSVRPAPDMSGTAIITVTVSDGGLLASTSFTLTVAPVNDAPRIADIPPQETDEDKPITIPFQVTDIDGPVDRVTLSGRSEDQTLVRDQALQFGGSGADRTLTLQPEPDQNGQTTITVKASDGNLTGEYTFVLTVHPVNDGPRLDPIAPQEMDEDQVLVVPLGLHDIDTPVDDLTVTTQTGSPRLIPDINIRVEGSGGDRRLIIQPAPDRNGQATITATLSDGEWSHSQTFPVQIRPVNDPPVAVDDQTTVMTTPSINIGVLANDSDPDRDALRIVRTSQGQYGAVAINSDNTLRYLMPPDFMGTDVVSYTVADGHGGEDTAQVTIIVIE